MGLLDKLFGKGKDNSDANSDLKFTPSEELMDEDRFWNIIKQSKDKSFGDFEKQQVEFAKELRKLTPDNLILFGNRFRYFRGQANTWELWGAIYIIHGGCSDDCFNDFREWVIGQGKEFYYKTLTEPESLADIVKDKFEELDFEGHRFPRMI